MPCAFVRYQHRAAAQIPRDPTDPNVANPLVRSAPAGAEPTSATATE